VLDGFDHLFIRTLNDRAVNLRADEIMDMLTHVIDNWVSVAIDRQ